MRIHLLFIKYTIKHHGFGTVLSEQRVLVVLLLGSAWLVLPSSVNPGARQPLQGCAPSRSEKKQVLVAQQYYQDTDIFSASREHNGVEKQLSDN